MDYKKPQDTLVHGGIGLYPLTTADQVILSDGGRLEKDGKINADKLSGKTLAEIMLALYPVGAVYISVNSTSPASLFGGTWESISGRFLLGADDTYTAGSTGGEATHQHSYGFQYGAYYGALGLEQSDANTAGLLSYDNNNNITLTGSSTNSPGSKEATINSAATSSNKKIEILNIYTLLLNSYKSEERMDKMNNEDKSTLERMCSNFRRNIYE